MVKFYVIGRESRMIIKHFLGIIDHQEVKSDDIGETTL